MLDPSSLPVQQHAAHMALHERLAGLAPWLTGLCCPSIQDTCSIWCTCMSWCTAGAEASPQRSALTELHNQSWPVNYTRKHENAASHTGCTGEAPVIPIYTGMPRPGTMVSARPRALQEMKLCSTVRQEVKIPVYATCTRTQRSNSHLQWSCVPCNHTGTFIWSCAPPHHYLL